MSHNTVDILSKTIGVTLKAIILDIVGLLICFSLAVYGASLNLSVFESFLEMPHAMDFACISALIGCCFSILGILIFDVFQLFKKDSNPKHETNSADKR